MGTTRPSLARWSPSFDGFEMRVTVRARPGASRSALGGRFELADGTVALAISVTAPPTDGRANEALLRLLARALGVRPAQLELVGGSTGRTKVIEIPDECADAWFGLLTPGRGTHM